MSNEKLSLQERELLSTARTSDAIHGPQVLKFSEQHAAASAKVLSRKQLDAVHRFFQDIAQKFTLSISQLLHRSTEVKLNSVESITYSQFVFSRSNPTCLVVLDAAPLAEPWAIDFNPHLLYPILDCLLGGGRQPVTIPDRPPTDIEKRLTKRVTQLLLDELHCALEHVLSVELTVDQIHGNAQQVRIVAPSESVLTLVFRVEVAKQSGEFTLCMPMNSIGKMITKLTCEFSSGESPKLTTASENGHTRLTAKFGPIGISDEQLAGLNAGDYLFTDLSPNDLIAVHVDGKKRFDASLGANQNKKAVVIERES